MSALALFITGASTGLIAGGASCAAVQGGLLATAVTRRPDPVSACEPAMAGGVSGGSSGPASAMREPEEVSDPPGRPGLLARFGKDMATPVGAFLGAKLVSHALLGALLGTVGSAAQPSPRTRAYLLLGAAVLMVAFALNLMGVRAFRRLVPTMPQAWTRRVRRNARSDSAFAPAVLGFSTVLLPCGVTLSMALLAITSTSPVSGAAVMAGFVIGTAPLFAIVGFLLRQSTQILRGRLSIVTGIAVLAVAVWTSSSALRLGGWREVGGSGAIELSAASAVQVLPSGVQTVTLQVGESSYAPSAVLVRPGVRTRLVLQTSKLRGCTRTFVIPSRNLQQPLPETGSITVDLGVLKAGTLRYTCGLGMYGGRIVVEEAGA